MYVYNFNIHRILLMHVRNKLLCLICCCIFKIRKESLEKAVLIRSRFLRNWIQKSYGLQAAFQ